MAISQQQFVQNLVASGLMSGAEVEVFLQRLSAAERPTDA
jgi:hypothetical protein